MRRPILVPLLLLAPVLLLAACSRDSGNPAPPRVDTPLPVPVLTSTVAVPVIVSLDELERELNKDIPTTLWTIDERIAKCIPAERLSIKFLGIKKAKITPDIPCHVKGSATRGHIRLGGKDGLLTVTMPASARITASDAGEKIIHETATAEAEVVADVRLELDQDWQARAKVDLDYRWIKEPGVSIVGQRLRLTSKADPKLKSVIAKLEAKLSAMAANYNTREALAKNWAEAFTVIELNRKNPEVWMRVAPQAIHISPWSISGRTITLPVSVTARAETIIGHKPDAPEATPLPPPSPPMGVQRVQLHLPVIADYSVLEPVLAKALGKLSKKGLIVPKFGKVDVQFGKVSVYPTSGGRVAVGLEIAAKTPGDYIDPHGTIWLAGRPYNVPGSQNVSFNDIDISSRTDSEGFDLLVAIAEHPKVKAIIATALTQDFTKDLAKLRAKIDPKLAALPIGKSFVLNTVITNFTNGEVTAAGQGLLMPVTAEAEARLSLRLAPKAGPAPVKTASGQPSKTPPARL